MVCTIEEAVRHLREGRVVAFPTETVYGLGADARSPTACARIFETKGRPRFHPLIVHSLDLAGVEALVTALPAAARKLAETFWPGPLTMVLPKAASVPDLVTGGLPSVGVRVPRHPIARRLLEAFGGPLAAPSANRDGTVSATSAAHVEESFGGAVPVVDGGACPVGVESTIVGFLPEGVTLLRPGGIARADIERVTGPLRDPQAGAAAIAPGMHARHYATGKKIVLGGADETPPAHYRAGLLCLRTPKDAAKFAAVEALSERGDLAEAAAGLFAAMRRLDAREELHLIVARPFPSEGLGAAIQDRLRRAAEGWTLGQWLALAEPGRA